MTTKSNDGCLNPNLIVLYVNVHTDDTKKLNKKEIYANTRSVPLISIFVQNTVVSDKINFIIYTFDVPGFFPSYLFIKYHPFLIMHFN